MAASPPPTDGLPTSAATRSIQPGGIEITPRKTEIGNMGMADVTGGEGVSADTRTTASGNSSAANSMIQTKTEDKSAGEADKSEEDADTLIDWKIQREKAAGAGDENSSATNSKIQPSETKARAGKTKDKREKLAAGSALRVRGRSCLERFRNLNHDERVLVIIALVYLTFMLILTFIVPIVLLVRFHDQQMSQVWVISLALCSQAFFALLCIWRDWWFWTNITRLYFAPLLAFYVAAVIGNRTAIFILHFNTVWAAGYLGYAIALHRLREGTEQAIHALPNPWPHIKYSAQEETSWTFFVAFVLLVFWTTFVATAVYLLDVTEELSIVLILSQLGWISVLPWLAFVANELLDGVLQKDPMRSVGFLIPIVMFSPAIFYLSVVLLVLIHWVILMALVGFLGYNLAVYVCYLHTATPGHACS